MSIHPARILIVDDDPKLVELYSEYLRVRGHSVDVVRDNAEALGRLEQRAYEVLISKLSMPKVGAGELLDGLMELGSPVAPVLIAQASDLEGAVRALRSGARAVLRQPFSLGELHDCVLDAMRWHKELSASLPLPRAEALSQAAVDIDAESAGTLLQALADAALDYSQASLILLHEPGLGRVPVCGSGLFPVADPLGDREHLSAFVIPVRGPRSMGVQAELLVSGLHAVSPVASRALGVYCNIVAGALSLLRHQDPSPERSYAIAPWERSLPEPYRGLADPRLGDTHFHIALWWRLRTQGMRWLPAASRDQAADELLRRFAQAQEFLASLE